MCCQSDVSQNHMGTSGCYCGCCGQGTFSRRFLSAKEKIEMLEKYKNQLTKELEEVEKHIKELKNS